MSQSSQAKVNVTWGGIAGATSHSEQRLTNHREYLALVRPRCDCLPPHVAGPVPAPKPVERSGPAGLLRATLSFPTPTLPPRPHEGTRAVT